MQNLQARVPQYLRSDLKSASPGLRFGMYFAPNGLQNGSKIEALRQAAKLSTDDQCLCRAISNRQRTFYSTLADSERIELVGESIAPFTTGMGNAHPLENGFSFLIPYGLPYLPGSGVKGVVRRAMEELVHPNFSSLYSCTLVPPKLTDIWHLFGFERWSISNNALEGKWIDEFVINQQEIENYLNAVLKLEEEDNSRLRERLGDCQGDPQQLVKLVADQSLHMRGSLEFWDVIPEIQGHSLDVEIMTPHQSHYYQKNYAGSQSPHDSGQPTPIGFLTVPPKSKFRFFVHCNLILLRRFAPHLAEDGLWKNLLQRGFEHAFEWVGFGAKTAVGYGSMNLKKTMENHAYVEQKIRSIDDQVEQHLSVQTNPIDHELNDLCSRDQNKNQPKITVIIRELKANRWQGEKKIEIARRVRVWMQEDNSWTETSRKKQPEKDKHYQNTRFVMNCLTVD